MEQHEYHPWRNRYIAVTDGLLAVMALTALLLPQALTEDMQIGSVTPETGMNSPQPSHTLEPPQAGCMAPPK